MINSKSFVFSSFNNAGKLGNLFLWIDSSQLTYSLFYSLELEDDSTDFQTEEPKNRWQIVRGKLTSTGQVSRNLEIDTRVVSMFYRASMICKCEICALKYFREPASSIVSTVLDFHRILPFDFRSHRRASCLCSFFFPPRKNR